MPKVGVVIPCYNHADVLPEALESVAHQTVRPHCVVVVDDGSRDLLRDGPLDAKTWMFVVRHYENLGPSEARNTGILNLLNVGCDYILPLDADDMLEPEMIERGLRTLDTGVDMAYPSTEYFGWKRGGWKCPILPPEKVAKKIMHTNDMVVSTLYRAKVWKAVRDKNGHGYDPELHKPEHYGWEDWLFYIEAHLLGFRARAIGAQLLRVRLSPDSGVRRANQNADALWAYFTEKVKRLYDFDLPEMRL